MELEIAICAEGLEEDGPGCNIGAPSLGPAAAFPPPGIRLRPTIGAPGAGRALAIVGAAVLALAIEDPCRRGLRMGHALAGGVGGEADNGGVGVDGVAWTGCGQGERDQRHSGQADAMAANLKARGPNVTRSVLLSRLDLPDPFCLFLRWRDGLLILANFGWSQNSATHPTMAASSVEPQPQLPLEDYRRYGRQMILDGFGLDGRL